MEVTLEIMKGPETGRIFEFTEPDTFIVGRAKDATFRLPEDDPYISRRHFHLEINPPRCIFRDLESTNPPTINDQTRTRSIRPSPAPVARRHRPMGLATSSLVNLGPWRCHQV